MRALRAYNEAVNSYKGGWQPQLSLELALIDSLQQPEPVVQVVQQAAAQPAMAGSTAAAADIAPELVQPKRDADPSVPTAAINEKWDRVLGAMYKYNKTSPDVMRYFRAQRVEGNVVYLCTDNVVYFDRIHPYPAKRKIIEDALVDVFHVALSVQIVKVSTQEMEAAEAGMAVSNSVDASDSLLSTGLELGAEIKRLD